ncbi:hypothetical protein NEOLI_001178 [Neolecta irregularis DAH-3]|uniref:Uncharacterized protein n=1 Tax=Neolecta irregularis (strain DAH-3) TaxID=1198029 RepID=A0A1U7LMX7_NEOID|nr:hypothetical protein NEOLI_001178 [Neolecta irregularis DAH-3]|eukprot:OLL23997.1 hypothetical protein NEOLI_001178 [Neolecta irregularis DAH-3]
MPHLNLKSLFLGNTPKKHGQESVSVEEESQSVSNNLRQRQDRPCSLLPHDVQTKVTKKHCSPVLQRASVSSCSSSEECSSPCHGPLRFSATVDSIALAKARGVSSSSHRSDGKETLQLGKRQVRHSGN